MDKKKFKQLALLIAWGIILYVLLNHLGGLILLLRELLNLVLPLILGGVLAFVLNVPMHGLEEKLRKTQEKRGKTVRVKLNTAISAVVTFLIAAGVLAVIIGVIIPQLIDSVVSIYNLIMKKYPTLLESLEQRGFDTEPIRKWLEEFDLLKVIDQFKDRLFQILETAVSAASSTIQTLFSVFMGIIFSIYILVNKRKLAVQSRKMLYAYLKTNWADTIMEVASLSYRTFSKFISGQCLEAVILGCIFFVAMNILRLPYAAVISVMIVFLALIPYVGAFIGLVGGSLLIMLVSPMKALIFAIAFLVIQQVEGQLIYPRVVGNSVGLPPIWTLAAVLIGGAFFGAAGMIFFIPLTSVVYTLVRRDMNRRLEKKQGWTESNVAVEEGEKEGDCIDEGRSKE